MHPIVSLPEPMILGLHALGYLARFKGEYLTTQQIAEGLKTPEPHLSKVLQRLNRGGLIRSMKGPGGGYTINCDPKETSLKQLFEILGVVIKAGGCGLEGCEETGCFIGDMLDELAQALLRYLESRTMADFINYYQHKTPVSIELSVVTPSLGQKHPNFPHLDNIN